MVSLYRETTIDDTMAIVLILTVSSRTVARYSEATFARHLTVQIFLVIVDGPRVLSCKDKKGSLQKIAMNLFWC